MRGDTILDRNILAILGRWLAHGADLQQARQDELVGILHTP